VRRHAEPLLHEGNEGATSAVDDPVRVLAQPGVGHAQEHDVLGGDVEEGPLGLGEGPEAAQVGATAARQSRTARAIADRPSSALRPRRDFEGDPVAFMRARYGHGRRSGAAPSVAYGRPKVSKTFDRQRAIADARVRDYRLSAEGVHEMCALPSG